MLLPSIIKIILSTFTEENFTESKFHICLDSVQFLFEFAITKVDFEISLITNSRCYLRKKELSPQMFWSDTATRESSTLAMRIHCCNLRIETWDQLITYITFSYISTCKMMSVLKGTSSFRIKPFLLVKLSNLLLYMAGCFKCK